MAEKILVTGGAGFIGSHLVDALVDAGHKVRVLDNLEPQVHGGLREQGAWPVYANPDAQYILGDVRDIEAVSKALAGVTVVFHQAAMVGVGQSMYQIARYTDVNTNGAATVLQAIVDSKERPRKLVVASSMSIYGEGAYTCPKHGPVYPRLRGSDQLQARAWEMRCPVEACSNHLVPQPTAESKPLTPTSIYAINKRDHEEMFLAVGQAYQVPTVALRYFNTYGARQALSNPYTGVGAIFASRLLNGKPPVIFEDGLQQRDFVHVSDIAQANLLVMANPAADFQVFNVGTGRPVTILQVAETLIHHMGVEVRPEIVHQSRAGDIRHCYADTRRLAALGYQPRREFETGMGELVRWVASQQAEDAFETARGELQSKGLAG